MKVKFKKLQRLKIEPWRYLDAHNEGPGASNGVLGGSLDTWSADSHYFGEEQDLDPRESKKLEPDPH